MGKFDAIALQVDKPSKMTILDPVSQQPIRDAEGKESFIELYSSDSPKGRTHQKNMLRQRLNMRGRGKLTPEQLEAESVDLLVALSVSWYLLTFEGKPLNVEFSQENARELYSSESMAWLREQVDTYTSDRANLSKASS
jgi:hypothetical protein